MRGQRRRNGKRKNFMPLAQSLPVVLCRNEVKLTWKTKEEPERGDMIPTRMKTMREEENK
jgi:hypothetical protein